MLPPRINLTIEFEMKKEMALLLQQLEVQREQLELYLERLSASPDGLCESLEFIDFQAHGTPVAHRRALTCSHFGHFNP
jgi:hypothetical protein